MADRPKGQTVRLIVTSCTVAYQGKNKRGDDYTIYDVGASREDGTPITDKKMTSFEDLPVGAPIELTVVPFNSEKHGLKYTLSRKGQGGGSAQRISELQQQITDLIERVQRLEAWARQQGGNGGAAAAPAPAAVARQQDLDERFGAEPPY